MKLKLDDAGHAVLQDGKPVYVHEDGKDYPFDGAEAFGKIKALNGEAKAHREAKEAAEAALKKFEGIEDPAAAVKALGIVKNLDEKKLVDAGKVDEIRAAAVASVEEKYKPVVERATALERELYSEKIGGAFSRSKFLAEKVTAPIGMVQATFSHHFEVKDGKTVAKDAAGNPIYSRAKPGELADFEEALETLIDAYPHKDHIMKASGAGGGGSPPKGGGGPTGGGGKQITRTQFDAMTPMDKATAMKAKTTVVDG